MAVKREVVEQRLKELDRVLQELEKHQHREFEEFGADLTLQWAVERGLIAAAEIVFDIANHVLAGAFATYPDTYAESLHGLRDNDVISTDLHDDLRGLAGFRNVLVHRYTEIDPRLVHDHLREGIGPLRRFGREVGEWVEGEHE